MHVLVSGRADDLRGRAQGGRHGRCAGAGGRARSGSSRAPSSPPTSTRSGSPSSTRTPRLFALDALDRAFDLRWLVRPEVGRAAARRSSSSTSTTTRPGSSRRRFLEVPRSGPRGRFFPIKEPGRPRALARGAARDARRLRARLTPRRARATSAHEVGTRRHEVRHGSSPTRRGMGLLGLLLPSRCAGCDVPGAALCDACRDALVRVAPPVCERCGCPGAWPVRRCVECSGRRLAFVRARAALVYDARARPLVSAWKERGRRDLAGAARRPRRRGRRTPRRRRAHVRPGRPRARPRARARARRRAWRAALAELWDVPVAAAPRAHAAPARARQAGLPRADRAANVRARSRPPGIPPPDRGARRRRLHDRRHGGGVRDARFVGRAHPASRWFASRRAVR